MKLLDYLNANILEIKEFAARIPVTEHSVYNWIYKGISPLRIYQLIIQKVTDGQVTLKDWGNDGGRKKKANGRVRSAKDNGLRPGKYMDVDPKAKLKSSKAK